MTAVEHLDSSLPDLNDMDQPRSGSIRMFGLDLTVGDVRDLRAQLLVVRLPEECTDAASFIILRLPADR